MTQIGRPTIDLTGCRFGRLVVIGRGQNRSHHPRWVCQCDCGKIIDVYGHSLRGGKTKSCGCLNREISRQHNTKHGYTGGSQGKNHPMYVSWRAMKRRCQYDTRYIEKGISVCDRWEDFVNFLDDMGSLWFIGATLDRIDNQKSYTPDNCRWATHKEQAQNRGN